MGNSLDRGDMKPEESEANVEQGDGSKHGKSEQGSVKLEESVVAEAPEGKMYKEENTEDDGAEDTQKQVEKILMALENKLDKLIQQKDEQEERRAKSYLWDEMFKFSTWFSLSTR